MTRRKVDEQREALETVIYNGEKWQVFKLVLGGKYAWIERRSGKDVHGRFAPVANLHSPEEAEVKL